MQFLALSLVWCSYFGYSASVRGSGGSLHFLAFNSTQSNNFMLKYSTDVYFILITNNIYIAYMVNICTLPLLKHFYEVKCYLFLVCFL